MYLPGPSYQAQGGFFDCEDFDPQIATMKEIVRGIEQSDIDDQITTAKGLEMVKLAFGMGTAVTNKAAEMRGELTNVFVKDEIDLAIDGIFESNNKNITIPLTLRVIQPARKAGQALISSAGFKRHIVSHIRAVIRSFETLAFLNEIKPGVLCLLGKILGFAAKIGEVFLSIGRTISAPFTASIEAAKNIAKAADKGLQITKILTIGGGLFLLYWYGLRKK